MSLRERGYAAICCGVGFIAFIQRLMPPVFGGILPDAVEDCGDIIHRIRPRGNSVSDGVKLSGGDRISAILA